MNKINNIGKNNSNAAVVEAVLAALIKVLVRTTIVCGNFLNIDSNHNNNSSCSSNTPTTATVNTNHSNCGSSSGRSSRISTHTDIYLRASGSGRRPQRCMGRLQISGHYAYPAVRALLSSSDRSRLAALNVMSCPLTQLYIPPVPGGVQRGSRGSRGFATSRKHEKIDKRSGAVCQAYYAASRIVCRRFQQDKWLKVPPQRTPRPSKVASTGFINFSMAFFTKS